jgi:REP element-mobilizing transposase RayT
LYLRERQGILDTAAQMQRDLTPQEHTRLAQLFSDHIEAALDRGMGACHLRDPRVGEMAFNAVRHFHDMRYRLETWCIMPNHVHVLLSPMGSHTLDSIVHSWKSFTSHAANKMLARRGTFWMPEYFDHLIRDAADFAHAHRYILENPAKAGLQNWPWAATLRK